MESTNQQTTLNSQDSTQNQLEELYIPDHILPPEILDSFENNLKEDNFNEQQIHKIIISLVIAILSNP